MKPAYSLFISSEGPIKRYLKQHDKILRRGSEFSIRYEDFIDSNTVVKLPEEDYIVLIRHEINGYRGSISIEGPNENKCKDLMIEFFNKTGAAMVSDTYLQFFIPFI